MTTEVKGRFYTYYANGQYGCKCFFCDNWLQPDQPRWFSAKIDGYPAVYACTKCFNGQGVREPGQEALPTNDNTPQQSPSREAAITRAHEENMSSAEATRNIIGVLVTSVNALQKRVERLANAMEKRNDILEKQLGAK